jgi:hypothetical protein
VLLSPDAGVWVVFNGFFPPTRKRGWVTIFIRNNLGLDQGGTSESLIDQNLMEEYQ